MASDERAEEITTAEVLSALMSLTRARVIADRKARKNEVRVNGEISLASIHHLTLIAIIAYITEIAGVFNGAVGATFHSRWTGV